MRNKKNICDEPEMDRQVKKTILLFYCVDSKIFMFQEQLRNLVNWFLVIQMMTEDKIQFYLNKGLFSSSSENVEKFIL